MNNDKPLLFDEETHTYTVDGEEYTSATTFISEFFPKFDAEKEAKKREYSYGKYKDKNKDEILDMWAESGRHGTDIHDQIERYIYDDIEYCDLDVKAKRGAGYYSVIRSKYESTVTYPELRVRSDKYKIAGTIDLLMQHPDKDGEEKYRLIDWKTNKKIYRKAYKDKTGTHRLTADVPAANYYKYELQLSLYAYILETEYGYNISKLTLCHLKPNGRKTYHVTYKKQLIQKMLKTRL